MDELLNGEPPGLWWAVLAAQLSTLCTVADLPYLRYT
jgi:hypothetical protein